MNELKSTSTNLVHAGLHTASWRNDGVSTIATDTASPVNSTSGIFAGSGIAFIITNDGVSEITIQVNINLLTLFRGVVV